MEVIQEQYKDTKIGLIPKDWEVKNLKECCSINQDSLSSSTKADFSFYYLDLSLVKKGNIDFPDDKVDFENAPSRARRKIKKGDILMSTVRPNLLGNGYISFNSEEYIASTGFAVLSNSKDTNGEFLYHYLYSHNMQSQIERMLVGSSYPAINNKDVEILKVPFPPLPEQQKIAEILSTVDEQIRTTQAIIDKSKELKKGLMQKLFSEGIGHTEFKETKIGRIPKDWDVVQLGELCEVITKGTTPTTNGFSYLEYGINFVKVESIDSFGQFKKQMFAYIGEDCHKSFKRSQLKEGDILISIAGALGRTAIVTNEILPANTNQAVGILRLENKSLNIFIRYFLDSHYLQKFIERVNVASAQANLNLGHLNKFHIAFPPRQEQEKISKILSEADAKIEKEEQEKAQLEQLKKGLMQQLLTGQKRVKI